MNHRMKMIMQFNHYACDFDVTFITYWLDILAIVYPREMSKHSYVIIHTQFYCSHPYETYMHTSGPGTFKITCCTKHKMRLLWRRKKDLQHSLKSMVNWIKVIIKNCSRRKSLGCNCDAARTKSKLLFMALRECKIDVFLMNK